MTLSTSRGTFSWLAAAVLIGCLVLPAFSAAAERAPSADALFSAGPVFGPRVAPPTATEIAAAHVLRPGNSRKVKVRTRDRRPGGLLEADITWSGRGPYSGKVYGSIQDVESDGYCVGAWVWQGNGVMPSLSRGYACPAGTAVPAYYSYKKRWRVLVEVCLVKHNRSYYCSGWK
jgi:hypothetical protein